MRWQMKSRLILTFDNLSSDPDGSRSVEQHLLGQPGVTRDFVSAVIEAAYVEYDATAISRAEIVEIVRAAGFSAEIALS